MGCCYYLQYILSVSYETKEIWNIEREEPDTLLKKNQIRRGRSCAVSLSYFVIRCVASKSVSNLCLCLISV